MLRLFFQAGFRQLIYFLGKFKPNSKAFKMLDKNPINKHIEVVTTSTIGMKETGFGSIETCKKVCDVLQTRYTQVNFNEVASEQDLICIADTNPDLVVLCVKYLTVENSETKIWLSDFFSQCGILHTGSSRTTLEYDSNKGKAKRTALDFGLPTARYFFAHPNVIKSERHLPLSLPLFIKPIDAANGNGIDENSLVHNFTSFENKVQELFSIYGVPALVEEYLPGREFTVAVLDDPSRNHRLISPVEIIVPKNTKGDRILGAQQKSNNNEELLEIKQPEKAILSELAGQVFSALGAQDFGRIDIKMDAVGTPYFMEANLIPGMTPETSYFPRAFFYNQGMWFENVVSKIVELALLRSEIPADIPPNNLSPMSTIRKNAA